MEHPWDVKKIGSAAVDCAFLLIVTDGVSFLLSAASLPGALLAGPELMSMQHL